MSTERLRPGRSVNQLVTPRRYGGLSRPNRIVRLNCLLDYMTLVSVTVVACRPQVILLNSDHVKICQFLVLGNTSTLSLISERQFYGAKRFSRVYSTRRHNYIFAWVGIIHAAANRRILKKCALI